jgi:ankyrin repeat protein
MAYIRKLPSTLQLNLQELEVLEVLLSKPSTDVTILDKCRNALLYLIAKQNLKDASEETVNKYKHCIRLLMNHSGINVNVVNRKGYTAVHFVAQNDAKEVVHTILEHAGDDLDVDSLKTQNGKNAAL